MSEKQEYTTDSLEPLRTKIVPLCICGHVESQHGEDTGTCLAPDPFRDDTCACGDYISGAFIHIDTAEALIAEAKRIGAAEGREPWLQLVRDGLTYLGGNPDRSMNIDHRSWRDRAQKMLAEAEKALDASR